MFDCCTYNCCDSGQFYNGCPPVNLCCRRSRSTEFPKQRGPFVEQKFSHYNPPRILYSTNNPNKTRVKTRSCSCSSKYARVSSNCKCKEKGILDCTKNGTGSTKRVCEKICELSKKQISDDKSSRGMNHNGRGSREISSKGKADNGRGPIPSKGKSYKSSAAIHSKKTPGNGLGAITSKEMPGNGSGGIPQEGIAGNDPGGIAQDGIAGSNPELVPSGTTTGLTNIYWQGPDGSSITFYNRPNDSPNLGVPVYNTNQVPGIRQIPQICDIPAAGLPTQQIPQFDPCTGVERMEPRQPTATCAQPQQNGTYGMPMTCMFPSCCPVECCPCPFPCPPLQQGLGQPTDPMPLNLNENENSKEQANEVNKTSFGNNSQDKTKISEGSKNKLKTARSVASGKSTRTDNLGTKVVNCGPASPELIDRICESLRVARPPDNCYILLPLTMASKNKAKDDPPEKNGKSKVNMANKPAEIESLNPEETIAPAESNAIDLVSSSPETSSSRPTRNCGCNTLMTGKFDDNSENPPINNSCGPTAGCTSGCCHRPRFTYCYNPCTGCFFWRQNCCCCGHNACGNNGGSCPIPKRTSTSGTTSTSKASQVVKGKKPAEPEKAKSPADDDRFLAGAITTFQPGAQDLYDQWLYQQHVGFPPMVPPMQPTAFKSSRPIYTRKSRFYSSQFQVKSQNRDEHRSPNIDWTPQ